VKRGDVQIKIIETGSLEPMAVVEIKSEQSGEIKKLYVQEGDKVTRGASLATIQLESNLARQAAQFRANVETEELNVKEAQRELERQRILLEKGFVSKKEVETAEKNLESAKIKHDLAKRQLFLLLGGNREVYQRYLERNLSSDQQDEFIIASPTSGTVIELKVSQGEIIASGTSTVGGGTPLMKIADLHKMRVISKINEVNISKVKIGQPVEIRLDAVSGKSYHGVVTHISPQGEKANNIVTYEVTMEIDSPDESLKPSMTANVDIITETLKGVLFLPVEAVAREGTEDVVYIHEKGRKVPVKVKVQTKTETLAVITEGLKEGDMIMVPTREKA
jgi:multidrug efflux pump subunit AcrA (membrane-fusion protein)